MLQRWILAFQMYSDPIVQTSVPLEWSQEGLNHSQPFTFWDPLQELNLGPLIS
jgi:hypothetical protein